MTKRKPASEHKPSGRRPWRTFTDEQIARMAALWHEGRSQTFIAREFDTAQITVSRILRTAGIEPVSGHYIPGRGPQSNNWKGGRLIGPGGYIVVLASGKDRAVAGSELHTNFKLDGDGEYLALVQPDGATITQEHAPAYPRQRDGFSAYSTMQPVWARRA